MTIGRHVNMFINGVRRERHSWRRAAWQDVGILHQLDHIGSMSATCTLNVIYVDASASEDSGCMFKEPSFV
jgi:hypothetical protein